MAVIAEASGKTESEILALRYGTPRSVSEGVEGEDAEAGKKMGWGQISHELGLHPGVLGNGTGDKFMPELPEIDTEAMDAVKTARERTMGRKAERRQARATAQLDRSGAKAEKTSGRSAMSKDRPGKVAKPDRGSRPDKVARPEKSNNGKKS